MATVTQDLPFSPSPALRARPDCKKLVLLGEIGGIEKYRVIDVVEKVIMKKPIVQALGSMADSDAEQHMQRTNPPLMLKETCEDWQFKERKESSMDYNQQFSSQPSQVSVVKGYSFALVHSS
ncbi:hypothetical protein M378DRAFT_14913 [Amanita muscaria Koide BX008]|uniref:Uncharacterized protein n=1 Tax=Amanita muscaria (strain Koide BX008) TaxID=946122 RepID=A0A0C2S919_AMAMK|nr:hypothetical protein M378DRAFT_14913 [Amanita muscaria Koide BX008]